MPDKTNPKQAKENETTQIDVESAVDTVKKLVLSLPGLFVLLSSPAILIVERFWLTGLNLDIPLGAGGASGGSFLTSDIIILLLYFAGLYLCLVIACMLILATCIFGGLLLLSSVPAVLFTLLKVKTVINKYRQKQFIAKLGNKLSPASKNKTEIDSAEHNARIEQSTITSQIKFNTSFEAFKATVQNAWDFLMKFLHLFLSLMFGTKDTPLSLAPIRILGLIAAAIFLFWSVEVEATDLAEQLESKKVCETIPREGKVSQFIPLKLVPSTGIPCGRITFSNRYPVAASALHARNSEINPLISKQVFHLGRYGDWVALAPIDKPSERILLKTSRVAEFSTIAPFIQTKAQPEVTAGDTDISDLALPKTLEHLSLDSSSFEVAAIISLANAFESATKKQRVDVDKLSALLDQKVTPKDLATHVESIEQVHNHRAAALLTLLRKEFTDDVNSSDHIPAWTAAVSALQDLKSGLITAVQGQENRNPSTVSRGFRPTVASAMVKTLGNDIVKSCRTQEPVSQIYFGEGSARVTDRSALNNIKALLLAAQWEPDSETHRFLTIIEGFASGSGSTRANQILAERRADNVKQSLIELLFEVGAAQNANAIGPMLLASSGMQVVAYGAGEALDGIGKHAPRRVDIYHCVLPTVSQSSASDEKLAQN